MRRGCRTSDGGGALWVVVHRGACAVASCGVQRRRRRPGVDDLGAGDESPRASELPIASLLPSSAHSPLPWVRRKPRHHNQTALSATTTN